jgi:hypothetical protein
MAFGTWKSCAGQGNTQGSPEAGEAPKKPTVTSGTRARRASSAFRNAPSQTNLCAKARRHISTPWERERRHSGVHQSHVA